MSTDGDRARAGELLVEARRLMALQRTHLAIPLLNEALSLDPQASAIRYHAGALALRQGEPGAALRHLSLCVEKEPDHAAAWSRIGACHMIARRYPAAAHAYLAASTGSGDESGPSWHLARALRLCGRLGEAERALHAVYEAGNVETAAAHDHALLRLALG